MVPERIDPSVSGQHRQLIGKSGSPQNHNIIFMINRIPLFWKLLGGVRRGAEITGTKSVSILECGGEAERASIPHLVGNGGQIGITADQEIGGQPQPPLGHVGHGRDTKSGVEASR